MLSALRFLFYAEFLLLLRRSQDWLYPLIFFILIMTLFPLAISPQPAVLQKIMPGGIWIAALFASLLAVQNIFSADCEDGNLEQLVLSPIPFTLLLYIKLSVLWLCTQLPLILITPLLGFLFALDNQTIGLLCLTLLLGTPILILMGGFCMALTLGLRQQGVLLGLIVFPLITPILIFSVTLIQEAQSQLSILGPLAFLAGLTVFAITTLPWLIACTLKLSLDK